MNLNVQLQPTTVLPLYLFGFLLIGIVSNFWCVDLESSSFATVLRGVLFKQPATRTFPLGSLFSLRVYCFALFALLCCNLVFRMNLLRISLRYFQFASECSTSSISCHHKVVRALWLLLLRLIRFYVRARAKVLQSKQLALLRLVS